MNNSTSTCTPNFEFSFTFFLKIQYQCEFKWFKLVLKKKNSLFWSATTYSKYTHIHAIGFIFNKPMQFSSFCALNNCLKLTLLCSILHTFPAQNWYSVWFCLNYWAIMRVHSSSAGGFSSICHIQSVRFIYVCVRVK